MASNATNRALNIDVLGLLDIGYDYAGTLYMQRSSVRKNKWITRFVIIARGWIYIFQDKNAKKAEKTFPLHNFNRVESHNHVVGEDFCFCLVFSDLQKKEPLIFACEVEEARQVWMKHFDAVIKTINGSSADSDYESITGEGRNTSNGVLMLSGNQPPILEVDGSGYLRTKQLKPFRRRMSGRSEQTEQMSPKDKCEKFMASVEFEFDQEAESEIFPKYETEHYSNQATGYSSRKYTRPPPLPDKLFGQPSSQGALLRNKTESDLLYKRIEEASLTKSFSYLDVACDSMSDASSFSTISKKSKYKGNASFICELQSTAVSVLKDQPVGNFLVCPGKKSTWLLLIKSQQGIFKIPIHTNEQNQTLSLGTNNPVFRSLGDLIEFYQLNKVPLEDADMVLKECGNKYNSAGVVTFV